MKTRIDLEAAFKETKAPAPADQETPAERPLAAPGGLDIETARERLKGFEFAVRSMNVESEALEINDDATNERGSEMAAQAAKLRKDITAAATALSGPAAEYVKSVRQFRDTFTKPLEAIIKELKFKIGRHQSRVYLEKKKREEIERKAAIAYQEQIDKEAEKAGIDPATIPAPPPTVPTEKKEPVRTQTGTTTVRMVWDFKVVDFAAVHDNFKKIDESNVKKSIKAGVRKMSGIEIFERPEVRTRTA